MEFNVMKKVLRISLSIFFIYFINSCSCRLSSPSIGITNQSDDYIYHLNGFWNGYKIGWKNREMEPGNFGSQNFTLEKRSDLFGTVHLEWENASGKTIIKEFEFKKEQFPNFSRKNRGIIELFFTQEDVKILIDPTERGTEEIKKEKYETIKISNDLHSVCLTGFVYPLPWFDYPNPDCKDVMPLYQLSNMLRIRKARKMREEKEKQNIKIIRKYNESKIKK